MECLDETHADGSEPPVEEITGTLLRLTDDSVARLIVGLYLVGSVALDDFHPVRSGIDFLAVLREPATPEHLGALAAAHRTIATRYRRPFFDGLYVTREELATDPRTLPPGPAVHEHRFTARSRAGARSGDMAYGGATPDAGPAGTPGDVTVWGDRAALVDRTRANVASCWHRVLGLARMHYTVATGAITSKRGAGEYALATFDRRLGELTGGRAGTRPPDATR